MQKTMESIIALCKRRGFMYPGSDLYGGLANTYDYGPAGTELLRNIRNVWWEYFVQRRDDIVGLDASLISHQKIWEASGHTTGFADAMIDCKNCKTRKRADHLIEEYFEKINKSTKVEGLTPDELDKIIVAEKIPCPNCKEFNWTSVRTFNLLFPVNLGIIEGEQSLAYLRGETAQGTFINFNNILNSTRIKFPFGVAQLGKSFRNEITLGNSVFRTIEFEQGEIEYFFDPKKTNWEELFESWKDTMLGFVSKKLGIKDENVRFRIHSNEERSFYSTRTEDLEYNFPFGFKEVWGLAYRTDYDLTQHGKFSGRDVSVTTEEGEKLIPHVIEPAVGINRLLLMVLCDAYQEDPSASSGQGRVVLKLHPSLAPYKAAVFPLVANKEELVKKARDLYTRLRKTYMVAWDDRGNIGKRYFAQDELGTPYCITIDYETLEDNMVTVRDRDTMTQQRLSLDCIESFLAEKSI